ncbi:MAG TPA: archease [Candidatus Krumholzibacteria bacterium]|nr:archease [Candidatus Krumholzibacteria bacterium]
MSYELLDHTGDVGIVVRARDIETLFAEAATAMFAILADAAEPRAAGTTAAMPHRETVPLPEAPTAEDLREFLADLLFRFSAEHVMYIRFASGSGVIETVWEPFDPGRHRLVTELKAVTYHQLRLERENEGWMAQVIFDV